MSEKNILYACPLCKARLKKEYPQYLCTNKKCQHSNHDEAFLETEGTPVLISPHQDSVCDPKKITSYITRGKSIFQPLQLLKTEKMQNLFYGNGLVTSKNCSKFLRKIKEVSKKPKILVIASGTKGIGTTELWDDSDIEVHGLDIYNSRTVDLVCDAHYIALDDNQYDGVWAQAVLEHVVNPEAVVEEIYRVLKVGGAVYAETPFMQQIHEGAYDFNRFGVLGHRYLFRRFEQVSIGGIGGPEVVLSWSIRYFFWAITRSRLVGKFFGLLSALILRPFSFLSSEEAMFDSPSGSFFLGLKGSGNTISHKDLIKLYKGNINP